MGSSMESHVVPAYQLWRSSLGPTIAYYILDDQKLVACRIVVRKACVFGLQSNQKSTDCGPAASDKQYTEVELRR